MNPYLKNLEKIEFAVTYACTGKCRHCSEGTHKSAGEHISAELAADAVRKIAKRYDIKTVMTFGGEPLLYPEVVYTVMRTASELCIPKRQVITNGYFSKDAGKMRQAAEQLSECGVNDLLLSVDAFHMEYIPFETVKCFARELLRAGVPVRTQPAWLVSREDNNPYNVETVRLLSEFSELGINCADGNVVFPSGNALLYLSEYFVGRNVVNPYIENPCDVKCVSFAPNGDVLDGNFYERDITDILEGYRMSLT